jgi:hypothetical protein
MDLHRHLPKVADLMNDYDVLNDKFNQKQMSDRESFNKNGETYNNIKDELMHIRFKFNSLSVDVDYIKRIFNNERLA